MSATSYLSSFLMYVFAWTPHFASAAGQSKKLDESGGEEKMSAQIKGFLKVRLWPITAQYFFSWRRQQQHHIKTYPCHHWLYLRLFHFLVEKDALRVDEKSVNPRDFKGKPVNPSQGSKRPHQLGTLTLTNNGHLPLQTVSWIRLQACTIVCRALQAVQGKQAKDVLNTAE